MSQFFIQSLSLLSNYSLIYLVALRSLIASVLYPSLFPHNFSHSFVHLFITFIANATVCPSYRIRGDSFTSPILNLFCSIQWCINVSCSHWNPGSYHFSDCPCRLVQKIQVRRLRFKSRVFLNFPHHLNTVELVVRTRVFGGERHGVKARLFACFFRWGLGNTLYSLTCFKGGVRFAWWLEHISTL